MHTKVSLEFDFPAGDPKQSYNSQNYQDFKMQMLQVNFQFLIWSDSYLKGVSLDDNKHGTGQKSNARHEVQIFNGL